YDVLSPAMLSLLADLAARARAANVPLSVCGEAASHPLEAITLVGLGGSSRSRPGRANTMCRCDARGSWSGGTQNRDSRRGADRHWRGDPTAMRPQGHGPEKIAEQRWILGIPEMWHARFTLFRWIPARCVVGKQGVSV